MLVWWELNPLSLAPAFLKVFFVKFARWFNVGFYKYKPLDIKKRTDLGIVFDKLEK